MTVFSGIAMPVFALPQGWQVIQGDVNFNQSGDTLTVTSGSQQAVVHYVSFNLKNGETVKFILPNSSASILNRVIGGGESIIAGNIIANGNVGLVNTAGIQIANTAQIQAIGFLASTLNIANDSYFSGVQKFTKGAGGGAIVNAGVIDAENVSLVGSQIVNTGAIIAENGQINLAVGDEITFHLSDNQVVSITVDEGIQEAINNLNAAIENRGVLTAHQVELKARLEDAAYMNAVNNEGLIHAVALNNTGGQIVIEGEGGVVSNSGVAYAGFTSQSPVAGTIRIRGDINHNSGIVAASGGVGEAGGHVELLGDVVVNEGSLIDVSGDTGGGTALIGGDFQGKGDVYTAKLNMADADTRVYADAVSNGDGGKVIFWSDEDTYFSGNIFARGGLESGDGGLAEVSGKGYLDMRGYADLTAPNGEKGTLLLDPTNIFIMSFTPLDNNPDVWLDAADASTISTSGGRVREWRDKSGNNNDAEDDGGSSTRPDYDNNVQNGLNAIDFDGNNDRLYINNYNVASGSNDRTLYLTFFNGQDTGAPYQNILHYGDNSGTQAFGLAYDYANGGRLAVDYWNDATLTTTWNNGNPYNFQGAFDGDDVSYYVNGVGGINTNEPVNTDNGGNFWIGSEIGGGQSYFEGHIGEIFAFDKVLSEQERQLLEQYSFEKWGFNVNTTTLNNVYLSKTNTYLNEVYLEALSQGSNISLQASNTITVDNLTDNLLNLGNRDFTLDAGNDIVFNDVNDTISTQGGDIDFTAGDDMTLGHLVTNGGTVTLDAGGNVTGNSIDVNNSSINITSGGNINSAGNLLDIDAGTLVVNANGGGWFSETNAITVNNSNVGGAFEIVNNTAGTDIVIQNTDVTGATTITSQRNLTAQTNNTFGTLTVTGNGAITIYETGDDMDINLITNNSATDGLFLHSTTGDIHGKGTGAVDINSPGTGLIIALAGAGTGNTASDLNLNVNTGGDVWALATGRDGSNNSVQLRGDISRSLLAGGFNGSTFVASTGDITLGDATDTLNVTGNTALSAAANRTASGRGNFVGAVSGDAGWIDFHDTGGDFTSGGLTASGGSGESLVAVAEQGDVLGAYTTSGAGSMRLQAGTSSTLGAGYAVDASSLNAAGNVSLYATGANSGRAIRVQSGSIAGDITATGINAAYNQVAANGDIDITLGSGNLTTALIWTGPDDVRLTASNGSILQDTKYGYQNRTIFAVNGGDITLRALGSGASGRVDVGVLGLGVTSDLTVHAHGSSTGNINGISARLYGRIDGNATITDSGGGNMVGEAWLGTGVGDPLDLNDVYTVFDVRGNTLVRANGDVFMYGAFGDAGSATVYGRSLTAVLDKWDFNINLIETTTASGTGANIDALHGSILGGTIDAGSANVYLQAGSQSPRDKMKHVDLGSVVTSNLDIIVAGTTTGSTSGVSVNISGGSVGSYNVQHLYNDIYLGTINIP